MDSVSRITIFHLYRKDGRALFLHPFNKPEIFLDMPEDMEIVGKYGQEPDVENIIEFRDELYNQVEDSVRKTMQDLRFIPNIIVSALTFLGVYFLMSFGVRDPIPMLDEVLAALLVTGFVYIRRIKKDRNRPKAQELRETLRARIDAIEFNEDNFVKEIEDLLHRYESVSSEKLLESIMVPKEVTFSNRELDDARQLLAYLDRRFSSKLYRRQERSINRMKKSNINGPAGKSLAAMVNLGKIDLSLYLTYKSLKQVCQKEA